MEDDGRGRASADPGRTDAAIVAAGLRVEERIDTTS